MFMITKVMLDNLFEQFSMTWYHVMSKITMCNVHLDLHLR
jgi:ribosome-associated toxin RatA of RatAB toxin-antitoxin module